MDKASHYTSGDFRFESWKGLNISSDTKIDCIPNIYCHYYLIQIRGIVAQWIKQLSTHQGIPGSSPGKVVIFCLILRYTLYLIFTVIIVYINAVWLRPNG